MWTLQKYRKKELIQGRSRNKQTISKRKNLRKKKTKKNPKPCQIKQSIQSQKKSQSPEVKWTNKKKLSLLHLQML